MTSSSNARTGGIALVVVPGIALSFLGLRAASLLAAETAPQIAAALVVVLAAIGAGEIALQFGRRVFRASRTERDSVAERLAIGFAAFGTVIALVAWAGFALATATIVVTAGAAAVGMFVVIRDRSGIRLPRLSWPVLLLVPPVVLALASAIAPVNSPDELTYKLAVPHAWQLYGRMMEMPWSSHSYLVLSLHLTDLAAVVIGGGVAAKLAHFALFLAALAIVYRGVARRHNDAAIWAVVVLAWTPALAVIAGWAWDEWGVVALVVLALDRYEKWRAGDESADAAAAFVAAGCVASIKFGRERAGFGTQAARRHVPPCARALGIASVIAPPACSSGSTCSRFHS